MEDQLQDFVQHMLDAGASKDTIDEGIRLYQTQHPPVAPVAVSRHEAGMGHDPIANAINRVSPGTGDYLEGAGQGLREGVIGGAKGFVKGLPGGVVSGAKEIVKSPYTLGMGLWNAGVGGYHLATDFKKTASKSVDDMSAMPGKVGDAISAAATKAAVDPEGFGHDVGHLTGTAEAAVLAAHAIPLAPKPIARRLGPVVEGFGKKAQWPMQITGAHQLLQGNPAGVIPMVLPEVLQRTGRKISGFGEDPALVQAESDAMLQRGGSGAPKPSIRVTGPPKDYYNVAKENAAEAAAAKGGGVVDPNAPPAGWPAGVPYDKSRLVGEIQPLKKGPAVRVLGRTAPAEPIVTSEPAVPNMDRAAAEPGRGPSNGDRYSAATTRADVDRRVSSDARPAGSVERRVDQRRATPDSGQPITGDATTRAAAPKAARIATQEGVPASKSRSPMSKTPGLTRADLEAVGMNPDLNYKDLTPDMVDKIKSMRASRHQTNYANAQTDKTLRSFGDVLRARFDPERLR